MTKRWQSIRFARLGLIAMLVALLLTVQLADGSRHALAHASLVEAQPAADAELAGAPEQIALTFNERLEDGLYWIRVFDKARKQVTNQPAVMNDAHMGLSLKLPKLDKGTYVVTYHIISADGHPVEGTYLFAVGESLTRPPGAAADPGMDHLHMHNDPFQRFGLKDVVQFASRIAFYISMLAFTGWLLWSRWFASKTHDGPKAMLALWRERLQQAYLIVYIVFMGVHLIDMIGDGGRDAVITLFTRTASGYAWLGGLVLALLSFVLLQRSAWLDYAWVAAVWLDKGFLGHAAAFTPVTETLLLDWLHLFASSVWVGGLLMLGVLWRREREQAIRLYPSFSTAALLSIVLLIASGVLSAVLFLPDIRYVVETLWGKLLLVKTGLVAAVAVTAACLRYAFKKRREASAGVLLGIDTGLMLLIAGIVGVFTYLTPLPANQPLNWHVMGEKIHMTAQISPNAPGVNEFTVKVWLPEPLGKPKQVLMKLQQEGDAGIAPIEVPLSPFVDQDFDESYGMKKYTYKAKGSYLPYPGKWELEIRVMDSNDDETVYDKELKIF
ncbi:copper resistance protein CopC [Paenibacillus filicis]|uniref:Copper resistance protein CopC n=1 Tax=Paenibacillus gyeongsangnamensis TaxID=3388067 RepID=A0ABT4QHH0_9BACL|nr:copper resistance protein CopC [Paenibacillus filicis]MCZ8516331.1 copper resistance protein CopC [Paenibacillus filicis]